MSGTLRVHRTTSLELASIHKELSLVDLDTFSSVRRPKNSGKIWKKKWSSNTSNVDLSAVSLSKLNKNVTRYSRKDLLSCNNSHLGETSSAYVCNDAMNVSCNPRMCDLLDDNNFFIFYDESVKISPVSKMPFRKKPRDSMNVCSKSNMIKSLPRIVQNPSVSQLQVQRVRTDNDTEFKNKTLAKFFDEVGITQQFSAARMPQQNGVVERRNITLVEAARTMLTFSNLPSFIWAEAITTACFTQNRLIIHKRFDKTPYKLMNKRKPNIKFFCVFRWRCYLLNDYEDVGKLKAKGDITVFVGYSKESEMASKQFSLEPGLSNLNETGKSSNPLVSKVSEASKKDLEDLFQDFYDEYFDSSKIMKSSTTNVETPINEEVFHETKDHPLYKIIGDPKSSVRTKGQLANSCLFSCLLNSIEPANVAEALRDADWVSAMQEELDQFARLKSYSYIQKVIDSYDLPMSEFLAVCLDVPPHLVTEETTSGVDVEDAAQQPPSFALKITSDTPFSITI
uniref:Retrovirus-related Pol polyprotein from transposon TNT 1-94 n=1 Tax=Tanacetum cinerariifolium TaxID=118510 RepID=A0A6L2MIQ3_TANCI|nr:retrovirus-related Pol polyprotein from transposon TNT 1-94 [Tanacetum cinerariifolium]